MLKKARIDLFTQTDPIGLRGGANLYGYGLGDPVNNRDPFGLAVYYNCRGIFGTFVQHCALRIITDDITVCTELLKSGWRNDVTWDVGCGGTLDDYDETWTMLAVPEGMSSREFDDAVLDAAQKARNARHGDWYDPSACGNSNHHVTDIVRAAGGNIPTQWNAPGLGHPWRNQHCH